MVRLTDIVTAFAKGITRSKVSLIGAMLTTVVFPLLLGSIILDLLGHITNPYFGFVIYMVMGPLFILGLVLVFLGLFFFKGQVDVGLFTLEYLREQFNDPARFSRIRKLIFIGVFLTCINLFVIALLAYSGYHYMESVGFCGQFCHSVMNPEYTAYKNSPHSRVACVECHIGSGAQWFVKSKISGSRQLVAVALNTYPRPIETPVHGLRPARETCEECHRPELFHGDKLVHREKFKDDEANTQVNTVMLVKVGSAGDRSVSSHGIHWHVAPENKITYRATDHSRKEIVEVTLARPDGTQKVFRVKDAAAKTAAPEAELRVMDCIDCHNRPSHIYLNPHQALDRKIQEGTIPRELPFIKRQALEAVTRSYDSVENARSAIATDLSTWYQKNHADLLKAQPDLLPRAIKGVQAAYAENVFPTMNIGWGTYINHIGHGENFDIGCFRCHDGNHVSETGESISSDCNTCHSILAEDEQNPEILKTLGIKTK